MNLKELYAESLERVPDALSVELLLCRCFGISREYFWAHPGQSADLDARSRLCFERGLARLEREEPLAYISGEKEFFGLGFAVGRGVLIPRPETELLVEKALELISGTAAVLDIGSGSGNIAIAIAINSDAMVTALEKSRRALRFLRKNVNRYGLEKRVEIVEADLLPDSANCFDLIVTNPPYIAVPEWQLLAGTVRKHEPRMALLAGEDGLQCYRRILARAGKLLKSRGFLLLEAGFGQARAIDGIASVAGWKCLSWFRDLSGIERAGLFRMG